MKNGGEAQFQEYNKFMLKQLNQLVFVCQKCDPSKKYLYHDFIQHKTRDCPHRVVYYPL